MQDKPFALIGVNSDDLERAKSAVEKNHLNWRSFQNQPEGQENKISGAWAVTGWPTVVVIDADGVIRYRGHDGAGKATEVAKQLVEKLQAAPAK